MGGREWRRAALAALLALAWVGCRSGSPERTATPTVSEPDTAPARGAKSVNPGINASYKDADVSKFVERFEREGREIYRERLAIVKAIGVKPGDVVADIGAGTGLFTGLLATATKPGGKVYAVDIVPNFLEHIAQRLEQEGIDNVETVLCKEDSVELRPNSINIAFMCDTYHHFEYPKSTMASILRALRRGGRLVVIDFERNEGESSAWILEHVRTGKQMVIKEIQAAGFELIANGPTVKALKQNYVISFRKR